jgi:hypothetical protein
VVLSAVGDESTLSAEALGGKPIAVDLLPRFLVFKSFSRRMPLRGRRELAAPKVAAL